MHRSKGKKLYAAKLVVVKSLIGESLCLSRWSHDDSFMHIPHEKQSRDDLGHSLSFIHSSIDFDFGRTAGAGEDGS